MHSFNDSEGMKWDVSVTVGTVKRMRDALGIDLTEAVKVQNGKVTFDLIEKLSDPVLLVNVLYVVCRKQCEDRGITDETFGERLFGDAVDDATNAFLESLIDFFPEAKRKVLRSFKTTADRISARMKSELENVLTGPELEAEIQSGIEQSSKPLIGSEA